MSGFLAILSFLVDIYIWIVIAAVLFGWMLTFNLLNVNSRAIQVLHRVLRQLTEPIFQLIRRFVPVMGGIDFSPLILIVLLVFLQTFLRGLL